MTLGQVIQAEMVRRGWTVSRLAKAMPCSVATAHRWLSGESEPDMGSLFRLAELFGSRALYLMALGKSVEPMARQVGPAVERLAAAGVKLREHDGTRTCEREAA